MIRSHHKLSTWSLKAPILNSHLKVFPNVKDNKRIKITRLKTNYIYHKYKFTYIVYIYIYLNIYVYWKKEGTYEDGVNINTGHLSMFLFVCLSVVSVFFWIKSKSLDRWWVHGAEVLVADVSWWGERHCVVCLTLQMRYFSQVLGYLFLNIICISRQSRHV